MRQTIAPALVGLIGVEADYTPESLTKVEKEIDKMFPEGHQPMETTLILFGFYLGETIVRNISGAVWNTSKDPDYLADLAINFKTPDGAEACVFPFRRIRNFWEDRTDGLVAYYRGMELMAYGGLNMDKAETGEWTKFPSGLQFRATKTTKEEYEGRYGDRPF